MKEQTHRFIYFGLMLVMLVPTLLAMPNERPRLPITPHELTPIAGVVNWQRDIATTDTVLFEGFENADTYSLWGFVDNDGDGDSWSIYEEVPPPDTVAHSGIRGIGVIYNSAGNDDWLISPQLALPADETITLSLWAHSYSASFPEDFNVKLSTGGSTVSDFTITLGTETSISADWTEFTYDLSGYAGSNVYFAIQCVSVDDWYLFADDILVTSESSGSDAISSTTAGGDWSETTTWVGGVVPTAGDNVIIAGDVFLSTNSECNDLTIEAGNTLRSNTGFYQVLTVNGSLTNNGTLQNNGDTDLKIELLGDAVNHGTWANQKTTFSGTNDQTITMLPDASFENGLFVAENASSQVLAGSDLVFTNCELDFFESNEITDLVLPSGSGYTLSFTGANCFISYTTILANGNIVEMANGAYLGTSSYVENAYLQGEVIIQGNVYFSGDSIVNLGTLRTGSGQYYTLTSTADIVNYGIIQDNGSTKLYLELTDDIVNHGTWENDEIRLKGSFDQSVTIDADQSFSGTLEIYAMLGSTYQWNLDGTALPGETSEYLSLNGLTESDAGTYTCSTDEGASRAVDISVSGAVTPLAAGFTTDVISGVVPLTVQFTDASSGNVVSWSWDFGDGETSTDQNPEHTYTTAGTYSVSLEVSDGASTDMEMQTDLIQVTEPGGTPESYWSTLHPLPSATTIFDAKFLNNTDGFACGENGHVFRTMDGGTTWESMNVGIMDDLMGLDFPTATTGYTVGENGCIYKTTDGGETIISISLDSYDDYNDVGFVDENTGYIVGYNGVLLQTTDGGMNWTELDVTDISLYTIVFLNSTVGFIGGNDGLILKTTDGGENWTESRSADSGENFKAIYFLNDNTGWAVGGNGAIFKTTDGGGSWADLSVDTFYDYEGVYFVDDQTGYILRDYRIEKTTDGGATWESLFYESGYYMKCMAFATSDHAQAFASGGHIFNTDDQWETYTIQNSLTNETLSTVDFWDAAHGVVAGYDVILTTTDRGLTWEYQESSTGVKSVKFIDANTVIAACNSGKIIKSTDGGFTWENIETDAVPSNNLYGFSAPDATTFYAVGTDGTIVKSTDGGATWEQQSSGTDVDLNAVFFSSTTHGVAVGGAYNEAVILKTDNGGADWSAITSPASEELNGVYFIDDATGFAVGEDKTLTMTTDGGSTWTEITLTEPISTGYYDALNAIDFADPDNGIIVGEDRTYWTHDGGATWAYDTTMTSRRYFYGVDLYHPSLAFVCGMWGSILKYDTGALVGINEASIAAPMTFELRQNYPNPFNPTTTIRYALPQSTHIQLTVYNVNGQVVRTLANSFLPAGQYRVRWDGRDEMGQTVSTGLYLCRLAAGPHTRTIKMIYLK